MKTRFQLFTTKNTAKAISLFFISSLLAVRSFAGIIVTPAATSINISADKAANAVNPEFTVLGSMSIAETKANDFSSTNGVSKMLVLTAPAGWVFNTQAGKVQVNRGGDFKLVSMRLNENTIRISFIISGTKHIDQLNIEGIEVKASNGAILPCLGQIHIAASNSGTAIFLGLKSTANKDGRGGTNFGMVAQVSGIATALAFTSKPDSSITDIAFNQQPVVVTLDQFGNTTSNGLQEVQLVRIRLSAGSGSLDGTTVLNIGTSAGNGRVSFTDLGVDTEGSKKLMAISGSLIFAVTNEFIVTADNSSDVSTDAYDPDLVCYNGIVKANSII